ncbi:MAG TPA: peptidoglycan DD-metalloendopeptidase family protein [Meiothermus sp.]|nr:peptidoglycan DD-metalloendopeptidase family protein [Meiothermus sp.]
MSRSYLGVGLALLLSGAIAHYAEPLPDSKIAKPARQFGLPFATPPGPDTWLLGQPYGNTTGAYRRRDSDYRAGQGLHFGLDLSARCGTPVVAIGDGVVVEVDGPHGAPPHNLVIDHGGGLSSLYGHLLKRPSLKVGTRVKRGQVIALSGDSQFTCTSAPHLHLEIRDSSHQRFFNPILYLDADWDTLALGGAGRSFQRDLANPRRWQQLDDQPPARRGGALLNNFASTWPPGPGTRLPSLTGKFPGLEVARLHPTAYSAPGAGKPRRLTSGGCCVQPVWSPDSSQVLFLDRPGPQAPLGLYGVAVDNPAVPQPLLPLAFYSPDFAYAVQPGSPSTVLRRSDGKRFSLDTGGGNLLWSPKNAQVAWTVTADRGNFDTRSSQVFVSELGGKPRRVAALYGGGLQAWLDPDTLLLVGKPTPDSLRVMEVLDLKRDQRHTLTQALNLRGVLPSPGGHWIAYYVAFDAKERNGMFVTSRGGTVRKLPWFGSYRWRDQDRLLYIALEPGVKTHLLREYNAATGQTRTLIDLGAKVSNDQWQVSPDGKRVVFVNAQDRNLWVVELPN